MKRLLFLMVSLILLSNCIKQKYSVVHTLDNGVIVKKFGRPAYFCSGVLCPHEDTLEFYRNQKFYFDKIEGITYYDGYTFAIPDEYEMIDKGIIKYSPGNNATPITLPYKGFKKKNK